MFKFWSVWTSEGLIYCFILLCFQAECDVKATREELEREKETHQETKQKLNLVEKEAKSSNLMSMELEDYQRSIQALEGELTSRGHTLERVQKENQIHQETLQHMRRDAGVLRIVGMLIIVQVQCK